MIVLVRTEIQKQHRESPAKHDIAGSDLQSKGCLYRFSLRYNTEESWRRRSESNRHLGFFRPALSPHQLRRHWWQRRELNPLRPPLQGGALPMSYVAKHTL